MTDFNNNHILQSTFFNIDVYNDNSTGDDISSIYQTSLQSPLLIRPNEHEICCLVQYIYWNSVLIIICSLT